MIWAADTLVSTMTLAGLAEVRVDVPCLPPPTGVDGVLCHSLSGPTDVGFLSCVSVTKITSNLFLLAMSLSILILLSLTGSVPSERGWTRVGFSPLVLIKYALRVELAGMRRGGGLHALFILI